MDAPRRNRAIHREAKLHVRREPFGLERVAVAPQIVDDVAEVAGDEVRQHEAIVQLGSPANQRLIVGSLPEAGNERAQEQLLRQAHARMRRHLKRAQFDESLPAAAGFRRVELVDAELGAMRVAGQIDEQMPEHAIDDPRPRLAPVVDLGEGDLELVQRVVAAFVDARMLTGRSEEEAREEVRQRRVIVPVAKQAAQQIGPAQERTVGGRGAAEHHVIAAARPGMPAVEHELLSSQPGLVRFFVQRRRVLDDRRPVGRRLQVDFDDARIGRDLQVVEPRIRLWRRAFDEHGHAESPGGFLDLGDRDRGRPRSSPPAA